MNETDLMIEVPESDWNGMIEDIEELALSVRILRKRLAGYGINCEITDQDQKVHLEYEELNSLDLSIEDSGGMN